MQGMIQEEMQSQPASMRRRLQDPQSFGDFDVKDPYAASFLPTEELQASGVEPTRLAEVGTDLRQLTTHEARDARFANTFEMANFTCNSDDDEAPIGLVPTPRPESRPRVEMGAQFAMRARMNTPLSVKFEAPIPKTEMITPPAFRPVAPNLAAHSKVRQPVIPKTSSRPPALLVRPPTGFPDLPKTEASA